MLYALAIVLGILRWVPRASALFRWLPSRLQWLPSAVVAAAGVLAARLGWGPDALSGVIPAQWLQLADASLEAVVGFVLAAQAGMHPPPAINVTVAPLPKSVSLLFFGILLSGCASSFEEARLVAPQVGAMADRERCEELDDRRVFWGGAAKASAALAGASGLAALPVESHRAEVGLAAGALAAGALAAGAVYVSEAAGDRWVEECR